MANGTLLSGGDAVSAPVRMPSNADLLARLARMTLTHHRELYRGYEADAVTYWKNQCATKYNLLLSCSNHGLLRPEEEPLVTVERDRAIARDRRTRERRAVATAVASGTVRP